MKFQALFDAALEKQGRALIVNVDDNSIPFDGYYVPLDMSADFYAAPVETFDHEVKDVIQMLGGSGFIGITLDGDVVQTSYGFVFASKEYAMGYAHGAGLDGIYDVGVGKLIRRK